MAAVKYRGTTTGKKASTTTLAITLPAGTASGDFAVLFARSSVVGASFTTPEGWELLAESTHTTEAPGKQSVAIFTRKLTGTSGIDLPTLKASESGTIEYIVNVAEAGTYDTTTPVDGHSKGWQENAAAEGLTFTVTDPTASLTGDLDFAIFSQAQVPAAVASYTKDIEGTSSYSYHRAEMPSGAAFTEVTKTTKVAYNVFVVAIKAQAEVAAAQVMVI